MQRRRSSVFFLYLCGSKPNSHRGVGKPPPIGDQSDTRETKRVRKEGHFTKILLLSSKIMMITTIILNFLKGINKVVFIFKLICRGHPNAKCSHI